VGRGRGGERHVEHRGRRQHGIRAEPVVGQPGLGQRVEGARPDPCLRPAAEAEQRVVLPLVEQAGALHGRRMRGGPAVEGGERQAAPRHRAREAGAAPRVRAGREEPIRQRREGIGARRVALRKRGLDRGLGPCGARRITKVGLQDWMRPDFEEQARPPGQRGPHRGLEEDGLAQVAPPVGRAGEARLQPLPVTVENIGMLPAPGARPARSASRSSRTGSIAALWKA
jgi:hypothetical protein